MKPIEPDFWKGRGRYSKSAIRDNSRISRAPINKAPTAGPQREEIAPDDLFPAGVIDPFDESAEGKADGLAAQVEAEELPEIEDPIVEDLARQMGEPAGPSGLELDIEGVMDELGLTQAQRTLRRRKWDQDLNGLLGELLEERDNVNKAPRSGAGTSSDMPRDDLPLNGESAQPAPAAPSPLRLI